MGMPTVCATVCALAPGYTALTCTVGGVMSGYWAMGRIPSVTSPATTMSSANTVAKIGRSMKNFENIGFGINQFILVVDGMYFHSIPYLHQRFGDVAFPGSDACPYLA